MELVNTPTALYIDLSKASDTLLFDILLYTVAYIIYKYWLSSLNNERKKERRSLIKFSISELNYHSNISLFLGDKQKYGALYNTMNELKKLLLHYDPG